MTHLVSQWVAANAKLISVQSFEGEAGVSFQDFLAANRKACRAAWGKYMKGQRRTRSISQIRKRGECVCDNEKLLPPNGMRGRQRLRLWKCPVHGNAFAEIPTSPDPVLAERRG